MILSHTANICKQNDQNVPIRMGVSLSETSLPVLITVDAFGCKNINDLRNTVKQKDFFMFSIIYKNKQVCKRHVLISEHIETTKMISFVYYSP